ncbi:FAS1-like dehydratase domain-containing protein [Acuticoccus sp.]|uniref:FAS1-like dehydratase domain-containing protein n=1 Tax=Acuticoccus sp. TaxID=1904378 RepID=UPI003B515E7B
MGEPMDLEHLKSWVGRTDEAHDVLSVRLADGFAAMLDREETFADGDEAPLCLHWCLAPATVPNGATGPDGHPARGGFLPPVPLPRRMWAGGEIAFHAPLRVGDVVTRRSTIEDVAAKEGRSGRLVFVTVRHAYKTDRGTALTDRQDIVYRDAAPPDARQPQGPEPSHGADEVREVDATPLLLFRYSALTFNGHRIHYDRDYVTKEEGYPGLVVHGPLQATLLVQLAALALDGTPATFAYRGVAPLIDGATFTVNAARTGDGVVLWTAGADGRVRMSGEASRQPTGTTSTS